MGEGRNSASWWLEIMKMRVLCRFCHKDWSWSQQVASHKHWLELSYESRVALTEQAMQTQTDYFDDESFDDEY